MQTTRLESVTAISPTDWDALNPTRYPGLLHGFLASLELSGSVGGETGWTPYIVVAHDDHGLAGAMVLYLKTHSYGEYVFDWAWADAYARHGLNYYPKALTAVPFTPATGPRLLSRPDLSTESVSAAILAYLKSHLWPQVSSWHVLFPDETSTLALRPHAPLERHGVQFHWHNAGFQSFDDHLASFTSKRRKEVRRERRRVAEQGVSVSRYRGDELTDERLDILYQCYHMTYALRGQRGYLNRRFFSELRVRAPEAFVFALAYRGDTPIAMSFCLQDATTLYGRYWGSLEAVDCLHFETCFHQWIDYAIATERTVFDPGAQGEHKIARGFSPVRTRSLHWVNEPSFRDAIAAFLARERHHIAAYLTDCHDHTPFRALDGEQPLEIP